MMDQLIQEVNGLVDKEYQRAAAKFGPKNNSPHESYAVLLEETQEAVEQLNELLKRMDIFWRMVRSNDTGSQGAPLAGIRLAAVSGASELIQVAAMADKALMGYDDNKEER